MDADVRKFIQETVAQSRWEALRDLDMVDKFEELDNLPFQQLVDEYLALYESDEEFRSFVEPDDVVRLALIQTPEYRRHWHPSTVYYTLIYMPTGDMADRQQFEPEHRPKLGHVWYDGGDGVYLVMHEVVYYRAFSSELDAPESEVHDVYLLDVTAGCRYLDDACPGAPVCQTEPWVTWPKP